MSAFGSYISLRLLKAEIPQILFNNGIIKDKGEVNFSIFHIIFEPFIALFIKMFCFCKCSKTKIEKDQLIINTGLVKLNKELDII